MKGLSNSVAEFIDRFDLEPISGFVCFDAKILINSESLIAQLETAIQIEIVPHFADTLYFLNPDLGIKQFPTKFQSGDVDFYLSPKYGLVLNGKDNLYGQYKILIQPLNTDCAETTLEELKAKTFN